MNVCGADPVGRMLKLAMRLFTNGEVTAHYIMDTYGVSWSTAKRDMVRIEASLPVSVRFRGESSRTEKIVRLRKMARV